MGEVSRIQDGQLQTAIVGFNHPETNSSINLVATVHFGVQEYYDEIRDYAAARKNDVETGGAHVYCEGLTKPTEQELANVGTATRRAVARSQSAQAYYRRSLGLLMGKGLGLVFQGDALRPPEGEYWENNDITQLQFVQNLGVSATRAQIVGDRYYGFMHRLTSSFGLSRPGASYALRYMANGLEAPLPVLRQSREEKVVTNDRSDAALGVIKTRQQQEPDGKFVLIWGARPVRFMMRRLLAEGYEQSGENVWLPAARLTRS